MSQVDLSKKLFNMRGQFYPTHHILAMVPSEQAAHEAARDLIDAGVMEEDITVLSPDSIRANIASTAGESDDPMPSPGTEAETARRFIELANEGQWGLLIHSKRSENDEKTVELLQRHQVSYAERYRMLVIEDLVGNTG